MWFSALDSKGITNIQKSLGIDKKIKHFAFIEREKKEGGGGFREEVEDFFSWINKRQLKTIVDFKHSSFDNWKCNLKFNGNIKIHDLEKGFV